jgi:hypothetical protein
VALLNSKGGSRGGMISSGRESKGGLTQKEITTSGNADALAPPERGTRRVRKIDLGESPIYPNGRDPSTVLHPAALAQPPFPVYGSQERRKTSTSGLLQPKDTKKSASSGLATGRETPRKGFESSKPRTASGSDLTTLPVVGKREVPREAGTKPVAQTTGKNPGKTDLLESNQTATSGRRRLSEPSPVKTPSGPSLTAQPNLAGNPLNPTSVSPNGKGKVTLVPGSSSGKQTGDGAGEGPQRNAGPGPGLGAKRTASYPMEEKQTRTPMASPTVRAPQGSSQGGVTTGDPRQRSNTDTVKKPVVTAGQPTDPVAPGYDVTSKVLQETKEGPMSTRSSGRVTKPSSKAGPAMPKRNPVSSGG